MASEPVRSTTVVAAPKDYSIPPSQQIRLLSVRAEFHDNGAGGDWLPALEILDNNGNVLVTAADQGVKVTAGSDADVSWFPGVKKGGGAGGGAVSYAWGWRDNASGDPNLFINSGAQLNIPFLHTSTSNSGVMSWFTAVNANDRLQLSAQGLYVLYLSGSLTIQPDYAFFLVTSNSDQLQHSSINENAAAGASVPQNGVNTNSDYTVVNSSGSTVVRAYVQNNSTGTSTLAAAYLSAAYLGVPA